MTPEQMKGRTKQFALRVIRLADSLPRSGSGGVIGRQLLRAGTSVAANYRAACRARSQSEFVAKMGIVEEEADECLFWLELTTEAGLMKQDQLAETMREANEILSIVVTSIKTARGGRRTAGTRKPATRTDSP